ncbi:MAG: nitroreductase family protein [Firmicutes bacterium]|nr:nitroreductase family protein [Bacillota bacterium]
MNDTLKTIQNRYSCRSFSDRMPPEADLAAIANAGLAAPSGMNKQPWFLSVVKNRALISEMEQEGLAVIAAGEERSVYKRLTARWGKLFFDAPCMIMIAIKESEFPQGAHLIDLGIVAQNIVLAAASLGIDSLHCGLTAFCFAGDRAAEFKARLQFPEGFEPGYAVLAGYANERRAPHAINPQKVAVIE